MDDKLLVNIDGEKNAWVCKFCQGYMKRNKMPSTCHMNKLEIKDVEELLRLNKGGIQKTKMGKIASKKYNTLGPPHPPLLCPFLPQSGRYS